MPNPHPGLDHYVEAFRKMITLQTKVISFTHLMSTVGDLFPAKENCRLARERGILTLVDGAQTLGLLDVDLSDIQPDFYSGSAHKWPCGPKENGVLYINKRRSRRSERASPAPIPAASACRARSRGSVSATSRR